MMTKEGAIGNQRMTLIFIFGCGVLSYIVRAKAPALLSPPSLAVSVYASCIIFYGCVYTKNYGKFPKLFCKNGTKLQRLVEEHVPTAKTRYMPLYWFPEARCQTILANLLPRLPRLSFRREVLKDPDGGQFFLEWVDGRNSDRFLDNGLPPIVLFLPGITSTTKSNYVRSITHQLVQSGYRVAIMIYRGLDDMEVLTPKTYCATHTVDLEIAVEHIRQNYPNSKLFVVGTSLGSLILGNYLSETGSASGVDAAMLFSCLFNPPISAQELKRLINRVLVNMPVALERSRIYRSHSQVFDNILDHEKVLSSSDMRDFDHHFTAPVFGYESAEEYYEDCVLNQSKLQRIETPLLCVGSNDDPFSPEQGLPKDEIVSSNNVALLMTYGGGHVSHLQGMNPYNKTYFEDVMLEFFDAVMFHGNELQSS